jgi:hypothetical protein
VSIHQFKPETDTSFKTEAVLEKEKLREPISNRFSLVQGKNGRRFQPQEYTAVFRGLKFEPNALDRPKCNGQVKTDTKSSNL